MQKGDLPPKPPSFLTIIRHGKFRFYWFADTGVNCGRMWWDWYWYLVINCWFFSLEWEYDSSSEGACEDHYAALSTPEGSHHLEMDQPHAPADQSADASASETACPKDP